MPVNLFTGPLYLEAIVSLLVIMVMALAGSMLLRRTRFFTNDAPVRLVCGFAISYWSLTTLMLVAGLFGRLSLNFSLILLSALIFFGTWEVRKLLVDGKVENRVAGSDISPLKSYRLFLIACALPFLYAFLTALMPEVWVDALNYHLPIAREYAQTKSVSVMPDIYPSMYSLSSSLFYSLFFQIKVPLAAKVAHFWVGLFATGCTGLIAAKLWGRVAGVLAAALFLSMPMSAWLFSTANNDFFLPFVFAVCALVLIEYSRNRKISYLLLAGFFSGLLPGIKVTGFPALAVLTLFVYLVVRSGEKPRLKSLMRAGIFLCFATVAHLPWLIRSAIQTGNPIFPLLLDQFSLPSEMVTYLKFITYRIMTIYGSVHSPTVAPLSFFADLVLMPVRMILSPQQFGSLTPGLAVPLLCSFGIILRRKDSFIRLFTICLAAGVLLWMIGIRQTRFLLYIFPIACAMGGAILANESRLHSKKCTSVIFGLVVACWFVTLPGIWEKWRPEQWVLQPQISGDLLFGKIDRDTYLSQNHVIGPVYQAHGWANGNLPNGFCFLSMDDACHFFTKGHMIDSNQSVDGWWMQKDLMEGRIDDAFERMTKRGVGYILTTQEFDHTVDPIRQRLKMLYENERCRWYRLENL